MTEFKTAPFVPRAPWLSTDLQTLRNFIRRPRYDLLGASTDQRMVFPMRDGTGDRLLADHHLPLERPNKPLVVLIHGLTGCAESTYILASAAHLLTLGYPVLRLNLRGAGQSRKYCRDQYHAGRTEDLRTVLSLLPAEHTAHGIFAVGFSLGGNMLLKYLAEEGAKSPIHAAVSVSAPISLKIASLALMKRRNAFYHRWLMARMREEATTPLAAVSEAERQEIARAGTIYQWDDRYVAPRHGFASADDYYSRCSAKRTLVNIMTPTLMIHALDDPWIPGSSYTDFEWRLAPYLVPLLPKRGGHVGFHGIGTTTPWHDLHIGWFFEKLLSAR
jgi:predicted alpha/beta-fold hydrolase